MTIAPDPLEAELGEELRRRLTDLAATTVVDPDGRDEIERRLGAPRPTPWRRAGLVAAALLLVVGAVVLLQRDVRSKVETVDDRVTTTTTEARDPTTSTTTATSVPGDAGGPDPGLVPGAAPGAPGPPTGQTGSGGAALPTGESTPGVAPEPAPVPPPPAAPVEGTAPDGLVPAVTAEIGGEALAVTVWEDAAQDSYGLSVWRGGTEHVASWSWPRRPGQNCLGGSGMVLNLGGGSHRVHWGLARGDATEVRLVSTSMISAFTRLGPAGAGGLRPWIGEAPAGTLDHADARSARTILHVAPAGPEMDAYPDTC